MSSEFSRSRIFLAVLSLFLCFLRVFDNMGGGLLGAVVCDFASCLIDGLQCSINQEKYLRAFLKDGEVPIDNSASERSIRPFCVGRANWHVIDSIKGAQASAIVYSIAETAKANNLKPYEYLQRLLRLTKLLAAIMVASSFVKVPIIYRSQGFSCSCAFY